MHNYGCRNLSKSLGGNDKSTVGLKDFQTKKPWTLNQTNRHHNTSASVLKEDSWTMAPPTTSNLPEQNPLNEAPLPCQSN